MKKLDSKNINLETSQQLIVLLTYLTSPDIYLTLKDISLVKSYLNKIISIYERNLS